MKNQGASKDVFVLHLYQFDFHQNIYLELKLQEQSGILLVVILHFI